MARAEFFRARPGRRSQIRSMAVRGAHTRSVLIDLALALAEGFGTSAALVRFFDNKAAFRGWQQTPSELRDCDWPCWLAEVVIDTNDAGQLYAHHFRVALRPTGEPRDDVLKTELEN